MARLIEKGVDDLDWRRADARYYRGWTPLFAAVSAGSADCTRFLLGALADVDCVTAAGSTPLIEAAARGHVEIVTLLLQAGAETQAEAADRRLGSARALALANGHKECADLIDDCESERAAAADAAKQDHGPEKAAALAATEIVERDALQTAALERRSRQLWEAASQGDDVTLHTLLGEGADPNFRQRQSYYRAPLAAASLRGHSTCVQALIDAKALIDSPSDAGLTALMEAAIQGKDRVVECLIRNGALPRSSTAPAAPPRTTRSRRGAPLRLSSSTTPRAFATTSSADARAPPTRPPRPAKTITAPTSCSR